MTISGTPVLPPCFLPYLGPPFAAVYLCCRDLSTEKEYCIAFGEKGAVIPLIGLLNSDTQLSIKAARALRQLAEEDYIRPQIV